jgi:hypothetical protein
MSTTESNLPSPVGSETDREQELAHVRDALRGLRFGAVNIIVQDGVIVQIDRTEKRRVRRPDAK